MWRCVVARVVAIRLLDPEDRHYESWNVGKWSSDYTVSRLRRH